jgi:BirA family transcriptional regulator, biotin operon repressor / biotin---[acetyl-CoA-carboxylase] ligase
MNVSLIVLDEAESTQDAAREMALRGEPEGSAVMALQQTRGRGRQGNTWVSPPEKNLALSVVLRPLLPVRDVPFIGLLAGIAAAEVLRSCGVTAAAVKWPNDVLVKGRKIAGILAEASIADGRAEFVILGIGLNVNARVGDFPPALHGILTSMREETASEWDLRDMALRFLEGLGRLYDRAHGEGCAFVPQLWESLWAHRGVLMNYQGTAGEALGLDHDGALRLRTKEGTMVRVTAGEVVPA